MLQSSREMGSVESNGLTNDSSSSVMGDMEDPVSEQKSKHPGDHTLPGSLPRQ